ncbi:MAG: hypothetical protein OCD01_03700 [Fibrobacterales bacterium]
MSEKYLKVFLIGFIAIVVWQLFSSGEKGSTSNYNVNVQTKVTAEKGLDLKTVGSLLKEAKDGADLERLLNSKTTGVNNLDLNEDGVVDYINVTEFGSAAEKGYSLTVEVEKDDVQEVATIEVKQAGEQQAEVAVRGNQQMYGHNHYYQSRFGITDYLFLSWAFGRRPFYASPFGFGAYPSYYGGGYRTRSYSDYGRYTSRRTNGSNFNKGSQARQSTMKSPNASRSASKVRAPMKNPSRKQMDYQKRFPSKQVKRTTGYKKKSTSSFFGKSNRSVRSSGFGRSGGFFGGK